jgi:hypothetical protein
MVEDLAKPGPSILSGMRSMLRRFLAPSVGGIQFLGRIPG